MSQFTFRSLFLRLPQEMFRVVKRFPLTIAFALVFTVTGIMLAGESSALGQRVWIEKFLMLSILALPLFTAAVLFGEQFQKRAASGIAQGIALLPPVLYFFILDTTQFGITEHLMAFLFSVAGAYLLFMAAPFFLQPESAKEDAWHFDRVLVTRFLVTFVCGAVLFLGLILAIGATNFLFDLEMNLDKWFMKTWILVVGAFGVWFFLHGIPDKKAALAAPYPKPLKILFFGILLPLLGLFTVILYAYVVRMVATWSWPKDGVAQWIVGFGGAAIGCFLIAFPLLVMYGWLRKIFFALFAILVPLLFVLFVGIGIRMVAYGLTINRLIVLVLGVWITAVAAFILIRRLRVAIQYILLSLAVVIVLASFGPWSIFATAARSQLARLERLLTVQGLLKDGVPVQETRAPLSGDDIKEIDSIIKYLSFNHELRGRRRWLDTVFEKENSMETRSQYEALQNYFGLTYSSSAPQETLPEQKKEDCF